MTNPFRRMGSWLHARTQTLKQLGHELAECNRAMRAADEELQASRKAREDLERQQRTSRYAPSADRPFDAPFFVKDQPPAAKPETSKDGN